MDTTGKIVYTTTGAYIYPYEEHQCKRLEFETSDFDKIYHKQIPHTGFYNPDLKAFVTYRMYAPKLKGYFPDYEVAYKDNYRGRTLKKFAMKVKPNKYQNSAITQLMNVSGHEAYINIPTASGKTVLAVTYICMHRKKAFIMCYSSKILEQWYDTFRDKTTIDMDRVMFLESSKQMSDILLGVKDTFDIDIFLCTSTMFDAFGSRYGYENYQELFKIMGVGLKIIDEAHTRLGSTIRCNGYTSIDMTLYLSADYNQANKHLLIQFKSVFKMVPVIKLEEELMSELRHINAIVCSFKSSPTLEEMLSVTGNKYGWSNIDYCRYEFNKDIIMETLKKIISTIMTSETGVSNVYGKPYKILVLTQLIEHVDFIYEELRTIAGTRSMSKFYSSLSRENKATALDCDIIISTYKSFSTGLDVTNPQIRHVISTCPVDPVTANQSAGRCRPIDNQKSFFWLLTDYSFVHCEANITKVTKYLKTNKIGSVTNFKMEGGELIGV